MPHIRFLFVRLAVCYRLPSSIRCLLDSAELLVLPATGRTVDFHHTITRALPGAPKKKRQIAAHFIGRFVRQTNMPLSHVGEAFDRLGKTVNGSVGITMFNAVTHTVFDMSLKNNAAAAVQC